MNVRSLLFVVLSTAGCLAYLADPPSTAASDTISDCSNWAIAANTDTCTSISSEAGISIDQFYTYNPSTKNGCKLVVGNSYCIEQNFGVPPSSTTSTTTSTKTTTTPTNGVKTPLPYQSGMATNCAKFYLVKSGDGCYDIAAANNFPLSSFYQANPSVGDNCQGLQPNFYVCTGLIGATTQTTSKPTSTKPSNGITTPTPTQAGMISSCNKFYLVVSGDGCSAIASRYSISLDQFYSWNPSPKGNNDCSGLQSGYYVCVSIIGLTTTTKPTTTTTTNDGTPTPHQSGLITSCAKFYRASAGDSCAGIASKYSIPLATFDLWNRDVGSGTVCTGLQSSVYYCVSSSGYKPPTTTTKTTTTTKGNGVSTPSPVQTGMTKNCKSFYLVNQNSQCNTIATKYKITLAEFYSWNPAVGKDKCDALWLGYWVCVAVLS